ncbi:hypothetical protein CYY_009910 [Polysphondylium violaceum]|uniref:Uncharacterized protein n=1 Tax=Polysphondylium violaceum TaxID=133409 RepID=A0A8J4PKN1_9MYCE|nr:hypothetical protein CYY_009910 [Polysphondylium violaceum]
MIASNNTREDLEKDNTIGNTKNLLLGKIESLVIVNDSLNTKIENLNQQQYTLKEQPGYSLEKIDSLTRVNE